MKRCCLRCVWHVWERFGIWNGIDLNFPSAIYNNLWNVYNEIQHFVLKYCVLSCDIQKYSFK
jgi:hypothetical protein